MPRLALSTRSAAPVEEVWKLLRDPARFPDCWVGVETVEPGVGGAYRMWPAGYPEFPPPGMITFASGFGPSRGLQTS